MNKDDIKDIPLGVFLIASVKIEIEDQENNATNYYENNLIIKVSSISHTHTIKSIPDIEPVYYYEVYIDIYAKEFEPDTDDPFEFFSAGKDGLLHDKIFIQEILEFRIWTPEDAPLTINWIWLSKQYKEIAFKE